MLNNSEVQCTAETANTQNSEALDSFKCLEFNEYSWNFYIGEKIL